jgi:hypothetical protein
MKRIDLDPTECLRHVPDHVGYMVTAKGRVVRLPELDPAADLKPAIGQPDGCFTLRKITRRSPLRVFCVAVTAPTLKRKHPLCTLSKEGVRSTHRAATIIAAAWHGSPPSPLHGLAYADGCGFR